MDQEKQVNDNAKIKFFGKMQITMLFSEQNL